MGSEPQYAKWPLLPLSQHVFTLTNPYASKSVQQAAVKVLQDAIAEHKMAPFYRFLAHPLEGILNTVGEGSSQSVPGKPPSRKSSLVGMIATKSQTTINLPWDEDLYKQLKSENDAELEGIQKEEDEAVEQAGDTEVQAARGKRAEFWARVGDKDRAITAYEDVFEKTGILGTKIDLVLAIVRMGLFYGDKLLTKKHVERAKALVESGGDWDRRNRLKAYEGLHLLTIRSYAATAPLLLDSLSTFTSYELCTYSSLVDKMLALSGALSAGPGADDSSSAEEASTSVKKGAKTAVNLTTLGSSTEQPEAEMAIDFSPLAQLVTSLYNGSYKFFFQALAQVEESFLAQDRYLHEHKQWFVREMRLRAYQQLLQSYRVVGLDTMATDFGVTVDFLDRDLARFIAAGRIPCTIDRVSGKGVIETNRPDDKNKQYQDVVRQGDQLITKLQKYGQAVRLRGSERA
ncbi:26S proteasome regulatory subunit rpn7 like protein [Verticillium longisporum]|uniref:26S proteasome regulatory subunit rpn7 like protein n=1 Tax=Verticillium longisporum TaxID=100787 RepID=A0A8I2Z9R5_VERLO|nr:26S proteasome regulatory subunit rpn7 like protein [Verticillium longisporum]